ncbi:MAG TPA: DEAD/DEAH box helicase [Azospirillum sp.]|nr:DEAD/DEAH box helicase [Azospirillum sp.]
MLDPIGGFGRIQDFFISYVETNFRISDIAAAEARRALLKTTNVLTTVPFIEPVLRYESHDQKLEELAVQAEGPLAPLSPEGRCAFVELALSGLFDGQPNEGNIRRKSAYAPYRHQVSMLERGLKPGHPGIVTSGTGSGKTESFMLPVLAAISNEAVKWRAPAKGYLQNAWWSQKGSKWTPKRHGEMRPSAVRALVLYPMNALVEDQMVRLRKTLDSDDARAVMNERFAGNRIFFGQYTSATPVTGYEKHPRMAGDEKEKTRRARRFKRLRLAMQAFERDQKAALAHDAQAEKEAAERGEPAPDKTRYIFPSLDGGEMTSRWDMHATAPDVLVTNASMLGAMLSREVEDPIFDQTRDWLLSNSDAYLYLIFDELHLIRGSAGTEVAFLIKALIERLGLDRPEHRHKLRILASSASLPMEGDRGIQSRNYLRDLFAPFGTSRGVQDPGSTNSDFWSECVVKGSPSIPEWKRGPVDAAPFARLLRAALADREDLVAKLNSTPELSLAIRQAAAELGASGETEDQLVKNLATAAAALLTNACRDGDGVRATAAAEVAKRVFRSNVEELDLALRGLMLARALPESGEWRSKLAAETPAFRVHAFIRNLEGLFAAPCVSEDGVTFTDFTVERGMSHAAPVSGEKRGRRLFELLYCEACGDLFIGGQRGQKSASSSATELLPSAADLESLPERAASEYYDSMTLEEFAVFWPRRRDPALPEKDYDQWEAAHLNPDTGVVTIERAVPQGRIGGYLYYQKDAAVTGPKGKVTSQKSAQPFCCPKCGTDYSNRPSTNRSRSPVRAFRTGVTKASQLVATELFELLHAVGAEPKGIAFSDSRQDAANQALEIERLHLRDLRREVLITTARACIEKMSGEWMTHDEFMKRFQALSGPENEANRAELAMRFAKQQGDSASANGGRKIKLDRLLQHSADDDSIGDLVAEFVRMGIHPFDEAGRKMFERMPWPQLFEKTGDVITYAKALPQSSRAMLNGMILEKQYELIDDVIFANTFFALEETGLAYPSASNGASTKADELDAWLRVFASATRVRDNKFADDGRMNEWVSGSNVSNKRVIRFAKKLFGENDYIEGLTNVLDQFSAIGHKSGMFEIGNLYLKVADASDLYWRCENCERVHLHLGVKRCTRCAESINETPTGKVEELWRTNFLGRRIIRSLSDGVNRFRLRVEELTGQTDDFSDRLRKFKDIFVDGESEIQKRASEIDMLSVTTTMEVGIDIGALQSVYQANMPPQRFNYQQRVGRAGRRGQAFSFVVTFCRGRSHDAYYFAHPEAITGDPPPPPFLAIDHDPIPLRLLRKAWLRAAFTLLRKECKENGETYPGDMLVPPDVHGEYVTTRDYFYDAAAEWPKRLRRALEHSIEERNRYACAATFDELQRERLLARSSVDELLREIGELREFAPNAEFGLARFLAEWGLLPMYGMPTRVRELYLGLRADKDVAQPDYEWSTMDRDLDLAVFEFAPGAILVKDKQKHRVIGFTGDLSEPQRRGADIELRTVSRWLEAKTYVALCPSCGSAKRDEKQPTTALECDDCQAPIPAEAFRLYVTPAAFRTDFLPKTDLDEVGRMAFRTVATVLREGERIDCGHMAVRRGADVTIMQLNDGVSGEDGEGERFAIDEALDLEVPVPRRLRPLPINGTQAIESSFIEKQRNGRWMVTHGSRLEFGLIALKKTDALYLELHNFDRRLTLDMVARRGASSHLPTRAAAISATQILVKKAALELDISPEEFEALEPRLRSGRPMLQIADALINGSGLCRRLGEAIGEGRPPEIVELVHTILRDDQAWPLQDFLGADSEGAHVDRCRTSCYRCVQRYGNRRYHGLLDWRLGLSYLRAMVTPGYACGLAPGDANLPEIEGWGERAHELAETIADMRRGTLAYVPLRHSRLPCLIERDLDGAEIARTVVVHPLWRTAPDVMSQLLGPDWSANLQFIDTFNLERRPLRALAALKEDPREGDLFPGAGTAL